MTLNVYSQWKESLSCEYFTFFLKKKLFWYYICSTRPPGPGSGGPYIRSVGRGVEREAVYLAFDSYRQNSAQWFLPRAGGYSSVAVTNTMAPVSKHRLKSLSVLGALTGLMLIHGMAPTPFSPVFIHFLLHDCNLHSIYPSFLAEWIPDLHQTLQHWLATDPTERDLSEFQAHFAIYHDIQVCLFFNKIIKFYSKF